MDKGRRGCLAWIGGSVLLLAALCVVYALAVAVRDVALDTPTTTRITECISLFPRLPLFPPTPTPAPPSLTATRRPTTTPSPTRSAAFDPDDPVTALYLDQLIELNTERMGIAGRLKALTTQVEESPTIALSKYYQATLRSELDLFEQNTAAMRQLKPPPSMTEAHEYLLQAGLHYDSFCELFWLGTIEFDMFLITQANDQLELGTKMTGRAMDLFEQLLP